MITFMLFAVVAAVFIITAELGARWWARRRTPYRVWSPGMRLDVRQDMFPELERRFRFEINADGERGSDVRGADDGLYRILVAGGSSVECFALDQAASWPGGLERLLNPPPALAILGAPRVPVCNIRPSRLRAAELGPHLE